MLIQTLSFYCTSISRAHAREEILGENREGETQLSKTLKVSQERNLLGQKSHSAKLSAGRQTSISRRVLILGLSARVLWGAVPGHQWTKVAGSTAAFSKTMSSQS